MRKPLITLLLATLLCLAGVLPAVAHGPDAGNGATRGFGYIGMPPEGMVDAADTEVFRQRVTEEAYAKAEGDKARFLLIALAVLLTHLAATKSGRLGRRLNAVFDGHTLGTVTGLVLLVLVIPTGIIIALNFNPSPWQAYYSVEATANRAGLAFLRNLHNWSAEAFIVLMILHTARVVSARAYFGKRKVIWLTGALLLAAGWTSFVAGSFLRGDQEAVEGFQHIMYALSLMPTGEHLVGFFSGELAVMRLMVLHIGLAVFALLLLGALHVLMGQVFRQIQRRWKRAAAYTAAVAGALVVQSLVSEAPLLRGLEAGPTITGMEITKPPWPIYFIVAWENLFGAATMAVTPAAVFLLLAIYPYLLEQLPLHQSQRQRVGTTAFYAALCGLLAMSYWAASGEIIAHIF